MKRLKERTGKYYLDVVWLIIHAGLGLSFLIVRPLSKVYASLLLVLGLIYIIKTQNKHNEALKVCAYLAGSDVFLRMTGGLIFSEQMKYTIILFMVLGMLYRNFSVKGYSYVFYILLLVPGIFYSGYNTLSYSAEFRKIIAFNLSGPVCTGVCALYCIDRKVTFEELRQIMYWFLMPIISMLAYITFFKVDISATFLNTTSNFAASGGYGPNQVSVLLGVGMFILFYRYLFYSEHLWLKILNLSLLAFTIYRGLITFSRGGVLTSLIASLVSMGILILYGKKNVRASLIKSVAVVGVSLFFVWGYSNLVSNGLLTKRYNNQDAVGREKDDALGGREELISYEIQAFLENPIMGIGVGNNKFYREEESDIEAASHNEITRLMSEHGSFGIMAFLILFFVPLFRFWQTHRNAFSLGFYIFWFLTINHNATRVAIPAFLYGLSVITLVNEKPVVHRKSVVGQG